MAASLYGGHSNLQSIFIRQAQEAEKISPGTPKTYLFLTDTSWSDEGYLRLVDVYPFILENSTIIQKNVGDADRQFLSVEILADPDTIILVLLSSHPEWEKAVDDRLASLGKIPCRIQWPEGYELVTIYAGRNYSLCRTK